MNYLYSKVELCIKITLIIISLYIFHVLIAISFENFPKNNNISFLIFSCSCTLILCALITKIKTTIGTLIIITSSAAIYYYNFSFLINTTHTTARELYYVYYIAYIIFNHFIYWVIEQIYWVIEHPVDFLGIFIVIVCLIPFFIVGVLVLLLIGGISNIFSGIREDDEKYTEEYERDRALFYNQKLKEKVRKQEQEERERRRERTQKNGDISIF